jgi:hypothetical protein
MSSDTLLRMLELEARQDEALAQLAELERKIEAVLADALPAIAKLGVGPQSDAAPPTCAGPLGLLPIAVDTA